MEYEGRCSGRRLRVRFADSIVTVDILSGSQKGSRFSFDIADLKALPDQISERGTTRFGVSSFVCLIGTVLALACLANWGVGITIPAFFIAIAVALVALVVAWTSPRRMVLLWSTRGGMQAFAFDQSSENSDSLAQFSLQARRKISEEQGKAAQPGATDNPDDAQRLREDH